MHGKAIASKVGTYLESMQNSTYSSVSPGERLDLMTTLDPVLGDVVDEISKTKNISTYVAEVVAAFYAAKKKSPDNIVSGLFANDEASTSNRFLLGLFSTEEAFAAARDAASNCVARVIRGAL